MLKAIQAFLGLFSGLVNLFNRSKDREAGRNEANLAARVAIDENRKEADKVWSGPSRGRIKRVRDKPVPPRDGE